jgi:hypothetical protein
MSEELAAVIDAVETPVSEVTPQESGESKLDDGAPRGTEQDRQDNRRNPDALKKHISDLRRQAEGITDPVEKKAALDRIKMLYDTSGKARGYEEQFSTVREAREVKALLDSVGGREGFQQMQSTIAEIEQIDAQLSAGDRAVVDRMFKEAPEGMPKLVGPIADTFESQNPQEYQKFIAPRSVRFLDQQGFPQAFDRMTRLYEAGKTDDAKEIRDQLVQWVVGNRQQAQETKQADPEVERLRKELDELKQGGESQKVNSAYNAVMDHAGPAIDKVLKPMVSKLGLSAEQYNLLRNDVWNHLQTARNEDATYKTVAPAKQRQGYDAWTDYAKRWTDDYAETSARAMVKARYGHQLQNGAKPNVQATKSPVTPSVQTGKEPSPSEIDYGPKGLMAARKAGFKDLGDMLLSGQAPLKAGGVRKWR